jgi:hypothetical protein
MLLRAFVPEKQRAQRIGDRLRGLLDKARSAVRAHGRHDMDEQDAGQSGQPDGQCARQMRSVRLPQDNYRQSFAETVQDHQRDVADKEQDERAKGQKMQAASGLPTVKDFNVPGKTRGNGG